MRNKNGIELTFIFFLISLAFISLNSCNSIDGALGTRAALIEAQYCPSEKAFITTQDMTIFPGITKTKARKMAPVFEALLPALADHGIAWVVDTIEEAADSFHTTVTTRTAGVFYAYSDTTFSARYGCIIIGRGELFTGKEEPANPDSREILGFDREPDLLLESRLDYQEEPEGLYVRTYPVFLEYRETLAAVGECKDLVVTYTFEFPVKASEATTEEGYEQTTLTVPVVMQPLSLCEGSTFHRPALKKLSSRWMRVPTPSEPGNEDKAYPVSLFVTVTETDKGHGAELAAHLAEALEESATDIADALKGDEN